MVCHSLLHLLFVWIRLVENPEQVSANKSCGLTANLQILCDSAPNNQVTLLRCLCAALCQCALHALSICLPLDLPVLISIHTPLCVPFSSNDALAAIVHTCLSSNLRRWEHLWRQWVPLPNGRGSPVGHVRFGKGRQRWAYNHGHGCL